MFMCSLLKRKKYKTCFACIKYFLLMEEELWKHLCCLSGLWSLLKHLGLLGRNCKPAGTGGYGRVKVALPNSRGMLYSTVKWGSNWDFYYRAAKYINGLWVLYGLLALSAVDAHLFCVLQNVSVSLPSQHHSQNELYIGIGLSVVLLAILILALFLTRRK